MMLQFHSMLISAGALTDEPPGVSGLVDLHSRRVDVGRISEEWEPHVLYMKVVESLRDANSVNSIRGPVGRDALPYRLNG